MQSKVTGHELLSRQSSDAKSVQYGGQTSLNMATESTSKTEKKDIFKDVRFFLADENNEEVCFNLLNTKMCAIVCKGAQTRLH